MSIRFNIRDRVTGERLIVDAPVRREFVKDDKRASWPPRREDCDNVRAILKARSVLGMRGACLYG